MVAMLSRPQCVNDDLCAKPKRGHAQNVIYWRPFQRTLVRANKVIRENGQLSIGADDYFFSRVIYRVPWTIICWSHGQLFVPADIFCSQGENLFEHSHLPTLNAKKRHGYKIIRSHGQCISLSHNCRDTPILGWTTINVISFWQRSEYHFTEGTIIGSI